MDKQVVVVCDLPADLVDSTSTHGITGQAQDRITSQLQGLGIKNVSFFTPENWATEYESRKR